MTSDQKKLSIVVVPDDVGGTGQWVAVCLEPYVAAQGESPFEALQRLVGALAGTDNIEAHYGPQRPVEAPEDLWQLVAARTPDEITAALKAHREYFEKHWPRGVAEEVEEGEG